MNPHLSVVIIAATVADVADEGDGVRQGVAAEGETEKGDPVKTYMFDTNIFNHILDGEIGISDLVGKASLCVTHIQLDELRNTKDDTRRAKLVGIFEALIQDRVPTESFVLDTSCLGEAKLTAEDNLYTPIKARLDQVNGNKSNNVQDALIAETAIKNNCTLITHDSDLYKVATEFGGTCAIFAQLRKDLVGE